MLRDAQQRGVREVILGLGGSATVDGGFGMARALGFRFFADERELTDGPAELVALTRIVAPAATAWRIIGAADVRNPLLGPTGAAHVFGPQKGADPHAVERLEAALNRLALCVGSAHHNVPGAGAAGGLGFGLVSFCDAELRAGFDVVAEATGLEAAVRGADVVITGEGRLDSQTLQGKAPAGVAELAQRNGKPVHAIVGERDSAAEGDQLFDSVTALVEGGQNRGDAIANPAPLLRERARALAAQLSAERS
jgi:glycerate kinase